MTVPASGTDRALILCIDDDITGIRVRRLLLEEAGFSVIPALSDQDGLQLFAEFPIDLVLTDHFLRGKTGVQIARSMKELKPHVPVLIFSAALDVPEDIGFADEFLAKSGDPDLLLKTISRLLRKRRNDTSSFILAEESSRLGSSRTDKKLPHPK
jgi:CheY-like chemotaxis protein